MIEEKYIDLINKEVDGIISEKEKNQLSEFLEKNPQAKIIYQEIIKTSELRKKYYDLDPSPNLKKKILSKIDSDRYTSDRNETIERSSIVDWFININPKVVYAFAAGLILGLIVYSVLLTDMNHKNELDNINFYGTIGIPETADVQKLDQVSLELSRETGTVNFFKFDKIIWFDINMITSDRYEMAFSFDQTKTSFASFKPLDHLMTTIRNEKDKIRITLDGNSHFLLLFTQNPTEKSQINLEIVHTTQAPFTYMFKVQSENK